MFGTAWIYRCRYEGKIVRMLDVSGSLQSATYLDNDNWCDLAFPYMRLYDRVFDTQPCPQEILMLGGGGFAFPKHVIAHRSPAHIDVVEIDPAIVRIAYQHFFVRRLEQEYPETKSRMRVFQTDALTHLQNCHNAGRRYDAILNDCYARQQLDTSLATPKALEIVADCLSPEGLYMINVVSALEGSESEPLMILVNALTTVFAYVGILPCGRTEPNQIDNVVVIGSQNNPHISDAITIFEELG